MKSVSIACALGLAMQASLTSAQKLEIRASIPALEEAARRDSNDAAAHYNLALGYWTKEKWALAERSLQTAVALDSRFAAAYLALAYVPVGAGQIEQKRVLILEMGRAVRVYVAPDSVLTRFMSLYRRAFMIDPLVDIRIQVATERRYGYKDNVDRAVFAFNDSKWDDAYRRFGELVDDSGSYRRASGVYDDILWYFALSAAHLAKHSEAIAAAERLVRRSQARAASDTTYHSPLRTSEYLYVLGYLRQRAGNANGALEAYREALGSDIGLYMAQVRMADVFEAAAQWPDTIRARRAAVDLNPDDPSLALDLGRTLANSGDFAGAEPVLQEAMTANSRDARVPYYLGIVQQQLNKKEEARASFNRFIELAPSRYARQIDNAKQRLAALR